MTRINSITTQPLFAAQGSVQVSVHVILRPHLILVVLCSLLFSSLSMPATVQAQGTCISLTALGSGSSYTQDFNTLSNTAGSVNNNLTLPGWYLSESGGGSRDNELYAVGTGSDNTGDT